MEMVKVNDTVWEEADPISIFQVLVTCHGPLNPSTVYNQGRVNNVTYDKKKIYRKQTATIVDSALDFQLHWNII